MSPRQEVVNLVAYPNFPPCPFALTLPSHTSLGYSILTVFSPSLTIIFLKVDILNESTPSQPLLGLFFREFLPVLITSQSWWQSVRGQNPPIFSSIFSLWDREKMNCGGEETFFIISSQRDQESSGETWDHLGCSERG